MKSDKKSSSDGEILIENRVSIALNSKRNFKTLIQNAAGFDALKIDTQRKKETEKS